MNETQRNIKRYKAALPGLRERITAAALLLAISLSMVVSASFAWYTISSAPEVSAINTTVAANGNLEIALVNPEGVAPEKSQIGDSSANLNQSLVEANITWGNLVNLSDASYGLSEISLRPALISGYNMTRAPLYGAIYGSDGRVLKIAETYEYVTYTDFGQDIFKFAGGDKMKYGVRAVASVKYENATGESFEKQISGDVDYAYAQTIDLYSKVVDNEKDVGGIKSMDALCKLLEIYVDEQAVRKLEENPDYMADYADVVYYMYNLVDAFCEINDKEGEALCHLANLMAYKAGTVTQDTLFKDIDEVAVAYKNGTLKSQYKVELVSLENTIGCYIRNRDDIYKAREQLSKYNSDAYKPANNPSGVYWYDTEVDGTKIPGIGNVVSYLVNIDEATIAESGGQPTKIKNISSLGTMTLAQMVMNASEKKPVEVVITKGTLKDTEQRLGSMMNGTKMAIPVNLEKGVPIIGSYSGTIHAKVKTDATDNNPPYNKYLAYYDREKVTSGSFSGQGEAVSKETYGMAMDLWVRTNTEGVNLILEGNVTTISEQATCVARDGTTVPVYTANFEEREWELYQLSESQPGENEGETVPVINWYNAATHVLVKSNDEMTAAGISPEPKMLEIVVGYQGENRIWEDFLSQIGDGVIPEESTTQGNGSCYVFYANPSDQPRILELLKSFTVAFLDREGNTLATACLDTERSYAINGKVTVPLKLIESKTTFEVPVGVTTEGEILTEERMAICAMEANQEVWITALVYLDGMRLTNQQVLDANEIEGRLNLQFGSSKSLTAGKNEDLLYDSRKISAQAYFTGNAATKSPESGKLEASYDGNSKKVTVELTVEGSQPNSIEGFFVRKISSSQGSRMKSEKFTRVEGTEQWTAEFDLSKPGEYMLQSVIADGVEYRLEKTGTDVAAEQYYPTVIIDGLGVLSVNCTYDTGNTLGQGTGTVLTAKDYVDVNVTVGIDAVPELMPKQVRAIFRDTNGKDWTAILTYTNNKWSGTARITASGTYTLTYVVMDGEYEDLFDEKYSDSFRPSIMVTLGLTAEIGCLNLPNGSVEFTGSSTPLGMTVRIVDDNGNELRGLQDVMLVYHSAASNLDLNGMDAQMNWYPSGATITLPNGKTWTSDGRYYGVMNMSSPGYFSFNRVDVTIVSDDGNESNSSIKKALNAPTFTCISKDPPEFVRNETDDYQFAPENLGRLPNSTYSDNGEIIDDGNATSGATMGVVLKNASAAKIWAVIENERGETYLVAHKTTAPGYIGEVQGDPKSSVFIFDVPQNSNLSYKYRGEQDGQWTIKALCFQNVYIPGETDSDGTMYSAGTDPTLDENSDAYYLNDGVCYVMNLENTPELAGNTTKVVETVSVSAWKNNVEYSGNQVYGDTTSAVFLTSYTESGIVLKLTDWQGKPVLVRNADAEANDGILEFIWEISYANNSTLSHGGYTADKQLVPNQINLTGTYDAAAGGYVVPSQTYQRAGIYTTTKVLFTYSGTQDVKTYDIMNNDTANDDLKISYEVWSKTPTANITAISPSGSHATKITYTTKSLPWGRGTEPTFTAATESGKSSVLDTANNTATCYAKATADNSTQRHGSFDVPKVTVTYAGFDTNSTISFTLYSGDTSKCPNVTFSRKGNGTVQQSIGAVGQIKTWTSNFVLTHTLDAYYGLGNNTITQVTAENNGVIYTITLPKAIAINNPSSVNQG